MLIADETDAAMPGFGCNYLHAEQVRVRQMRRDMREYVLEIPLLPGQGGPLPNAARGIHDESAPL
jgi:hypothetical protein